MDAKYFEESALFALRHKSSKINVFEEGDGGVVIEVPETMTNLDAEETKALYKHLKTIVKGD